MKKFWMYLLCLTIILMEAMPVFGIYDSMYNSYSDLGITEIVYEAEDFIFDKGF